MFNSMMARPVGVGEYGEGRILIVNAQHVFGGRLPTRHIDTNSDVDTIDGYRRMLILLISRR